MGKEKGGTNKEEKEIWVILPFGSNFTSPPPILNQLFPSPSVRTEEEVPPSVVPPRVGRGTFRFMPVAHFCTLVLSAEAAGLAQSNAPKMQKKERIKRLRGVQVNLFPFAGNVNGAMREEKHHSFATNDGNQSAKGEQLDETL
ncbi:hypothetical protein GPALN_003708 [Globodera pallida]|nr:hypothetical protein GPALN_003708 [Globodera pallida]